MRLNITLSLEAEVQDRQWMDGFSRPLLKSISFWLIWHTHKSWNKADKSVYREKISVVVFLVDGNFIKNTGLYDSFGVTMH